MRNSCFKLWSVNFMAEALKREKIFYTYSDYAL